jgi:hypothetical protein
MGKNLMKKTALTTILFLALASPALAGTAVLAKGKKEFKLHCQSSGCYLQQKLSGYKYGARKRLGPGGRDNFYYNLKKLSKQGYKKL